MLKIVQSMGSAGKNKEIINSWTTTYINQRIPNVNTPRSKSPGVQLTLAMEIRSAIHTINAPTAPPGTNTDGHDERTNDADETKRGTRRERKKNIGRKIKKRQTTTANAT